MTFKSPYSLSILWLTLGLAFLPAVRSTAFAADQDNPPATPAVEAAPTPEKKPDTGKLAPVAAEAEKPAPEKAAEPAADDKAAVAEKEQPPADAAAKEETEEKPLRSIGESTRRSHRADNARSSVFNDSTLPAGESADAVVSVFGSSTSAGTVGDAVVSVFGSSTSSGEVGDSVVSVLGNTRVNGGTVGDVAVAVLGNNYVNGHVKGQVVAVLGNVELGPEAVVDGDVVCVGGELIRNPKAVLHGNVQIVAIGGRHFNFDPLHTWFTQCLMYARPLAFNGHLWWAWAIALGFLGFYAFIALLAPGHVNKCVQTLEERPGKAILASLLAMLLTPVAYLLLTLTLFLVIGFALIPLFSLGLFLAALFGKVVMLAWLGRRITKVAGGTGLVHPALAVLIGGVLVLLLYTLPVVGFIVYKLMGILGLGVVIYTLLQSSRSSRPPKPQPVVAVAAPVAASSEAAASVPTVVEPPVVSPVVGLPPVISAATLPRAGFWLRLGATLLDLVMAGMIFGMLEGVFRIFFHAGGSFPFWFAVYHVLMWGTKGTTIGGIICGLKLVRVDDRPVDWSVAIVRALGAFLSLAVAGLGFIWVGFDDDRQSWHDKIAGTTIVRVPKGTALV
jgi:uncharacterized RDD family membrane protein YckC